jgi:hypothetical protein
MRKYVVLYSCCLILAALFFSSCQPKTSFSGLVVSRDGASLNDAQVSVNGFTTTTREGKFSIKVVQAPSYVVTVKKPGYSLYSKSFPAGIQDGKFILEQATVQTFPADQPIDLRDTVNRARPDINYGNAANPLAAVPRVYNADGKLIGFGWPASVKKEIETFNSLSTPINGFRVQIPAGALAASGNVSVAVTTINIFEPNAMPGDFSAQINEQQSGFMLSYGAGVIDVFQGNNSIQLNGKIKATISIPVDSSFLLTQKNVPDSIPFLTFDEKKGTWIQEGWGKYDKETNTYSAKTSHFSAFNFDVLKTNPSCAAFEFHKKTFTTADGSTGYDKPVGRALVEVYSTTTYRPQFGACFEAAGSTNPCGVVGCSAESGYLFKSGDCAPNDSLFAIKNIPNNSPLVFVVKTTSDPNNPANMDCKSNYSVVNNVAVIYTGAPATGLGAGNEPACDYDTNGCVKPPAFARTPSTYVRPLEMAGCATQNGTTYDVQLYWVFNFDSTSPNTMVLYQGMPGSDCGDDPTTEPTWSVSTATITSPDTYVYATTFTGLPAGQVYYKVRIVQGGVTHEACVSMDLSTAASCAASF